MVACNFARLFSPIILAPILLLLLIFLLLLVAVYDHVQRYSLHKGDMQLSEKQGTGIPLSS